MISSKTKKKLTLVLACSSLVTILSSCNYDNYNKDSKEEDINYDEEIHQILEENIEKCKKINESRETSKDDKYPAESTPIQSVEIPDRFVLVDNKINLEMEEYYDIVTPATFCDESFLNFLIDNNIKLGDEVPNDIFSATFNVDLSTFMVDYSLGAYSQDDSEISDSLSNMILIIKYNGFISDVYTDNFFYSTEDIESAINEFYYINNIGLRWNEVPSVTKSYQRSLNNN